MQLDAGTAETAIACRRGVSWMQLERLPGVTATSPAGTPTANDRCGLPLLADPAVVKRHALHDDVDGNPA